MADAGKETMLSDALTIVASYIEKISRNRARRLGSIEIQAQLEFSMDG